MQLTPLRSTRDVSRLTRLEPTLLAEVCDEFLAANIPWQVNYSEYQSKGWHMASLINDTGYSIDTSIRDGLPQPTELFLSLPATRHLLQSLGITYFWARAAKLEPDSFIWEHVDYLELQKRGRMRLHIPLLTNQRARLVLERTSVFLAPGFLWKLDPQAIHGAANRGDTPRIHLILDCLSDAGALPGLLAKEDLPEEFVQELPHLGQSELEVIVEQAKNAVRLENYEGAHHLLLKLFHSYSLSPGFTLTQVIDLYRSLGLTWYEQEWTERKRRFMGVTPAS
jgi:hypothetical protein